MLKIHAHSKAKSNEVIMIQPPSKAHSKAKSKEVMNHPPSKAHSKAKSKTNEVAFHPPSKTHSKAKSKEVVHHAHHSKAKSSNAMRSYPSNPKFAVMEHSMEVAGRTLYERREAKIHKRDGKRVMLVLIERAIDDEVIKTRVTRHADGSKEVLGEDTKLSPEQKEAFYSNWADMWTPKIPKEDGRIPPAMMELYHIEPFHILPAKSDVESEEAPPSVKHHHEHKSAGDKEGKASDKISKASDQISRASDQKSRASDEMSETSFLTTTKEDSGKKAAAMSHISTFRKKFGFKDLKHVSYRERTEGSSRQIDGALGAVVGEINELESEFEKIRYSERHLNKQLTALREDEDELKHKLHRLEGQIEGQEAEKAKRVSGVGSKKLEKIEADVQLVRETESKLKQMLKSIKKDENELKKAVKGIMSNLKDVEDGEAARRESERRKTERLSKRVQELKKDIEQRPRETAAAVPIAYHYGEPASELAFRQMAKDFAKHTKQMDAQRNREDLNLQLKIHREAKRGSKANDLNEREENASSDGEDGAANDDGEDYYPSNDVEDYIASNDADRKRHSGEKEHTKRRSQSRRRKQGSTTRQSSNNFSGTLSKSGGKRNSSNRPSTNARQRQYDSSIQRQGTYDYGKHKDKIAVKLDIDKATKTSNNGSSKRSNASDRHSQISIIFE